MSQVAEHHDHIRPEWLDGNGHMNLAYYVVVFDRGTDAWLDLAGLGDAYRREGGSVFAVETHTLYRQEVGLGDALHVRSWLVDTDTKRLHLAHEMTSGGTLVAMQECLFVHIDLATRRVQPFTPAQAAQMAALIHPAPSWLGRRIEVAAGPPLVER
ncbi:MAG TPA: thioesterase family protein [Acetobacteraceae bacterium]